MKWINRLNRALGTGRFKETDKYLASSWRTCAVGEMKGNPDSTLYYRTEAENYQGYRFSDAVKENDVRTAFDAYVTLLSLAREEV